MNVRLDHPVGSSNMNWTRIEGVHVSSFLLVVLIFFVEGCVRMYSGLVDSDYFHGPNV